MPESETLADSQTTEQAKPPTLEQIVDAVIARLQNTSLGSWYSVGQVSGHLGKWSVGEIMTAAAEMRLATLVINGVVHYSEDAGPKIHAFLDRRRR